MLNLGNLQWFTSVCLVNGDNYMTIFFYFSAFHICWTAADAHSAQLATWQDSADSSKNGGR